MVNLTESKKVGCPGRSHVSELGFGGEGDLCPVSEEHPRIAGPTCPRPTPSDNGY